MQRWPGSPVMALSRAGHLSRPRLHAAGPASGYPAARTSPLGLKCVPSGLMNMSIIRRRLYGCKRREACSNSLSTSGRWIWFGLMRRGLQRQMGLDSTNMTRSVNRHLNGTMPILTWWPAACRAWQRQRSTSLRFHRSSLYRTSHSSILLLNSLRSVDTVYFSDRGLEEAVAVHIRATLSERLTTSSGWKWLAGERAASIEMHIGPAIAAFFLASMAGSGQRRLTCSRKASIACSHSCRSSKKLAVGAPCPFVPDGDRIEPLFHPWKVPIPYVVGCMWREHISAQLSASAHQQQPARSPPRGSRARAQDCPAQRLRTELAYQQHPNDREGDETNRRR